MCLKTTMSKYFRNSCSKGKKKEKKNEVMEKKKKRKSKDFLQGKKRLFTHSPCLAFFSRKRGKKTWFGKS